MGVLAEHVVQFRAVGSESVIAATGRIKDSLSTIGSVAAAPMRALAGAITSVLNPANLLAGMGMGIGLNLSQGLASGIRSAVGLATQVETLATSFEVLLGSAGAARTMIDEINRFAATTPFEQMELAEVAKQLLAYGTAADQIIPTMRKLGDIAALSGANLADLAAIYGKVQAQGRLTAETLEGFQARGIPITRELANAFGVTEAQVRELVSQGKVGFADLQKAIEALTSQGGQFAGGMEKLSKTTAGLWSTVTGNFKTSLAEIGGLIIDTFNVKAILEWAGNSLARVAEWAANVRRWIAFVRDNWDLAWQIISEKVSLAVSNAWAYIEAFGKNIVEVAAWFSDNWRNVFSDIYNATTTIVTNLFTNIRNLWSAFWNWIKTGRWEFQWKGLTEGFKSSIKEWPRLVEANIMETTPELERLQREWERRWREATKATEIAAGGAPASQRAETQAEEAGTPQVGGARVAAAETGGVSFVGFAQLAVEMQRKAMEEMQRRATEAAQRTADAVSRLAGATDGNALRVKVDNLVAIYG
jgi:tape measure domain-containing protein